ncbi:MAG: hypothetical protein M3020_08850 [Myxococcota bacterium]|jgi:hypothetical protein|nr:hypothetical protein [Myxococcota bacterium]
MRNRAPDGRDLRGVIEAALEAQVGVLATDEAPSSGSVMGEVLDTHNPHLAGRVLVRFLNTKSEVVERWLEFERHLSLRKGDRVLLTLPLGWQQWIVTGALGRQPAPPAETSEASEDISEVRLAPGEGLKIVSHDGNPLVTIRQGAAGPEVELGGDNVELKAARVLKLSADTIELQASSGGIDLRTDGDTVVRARTIRLN